MKDNPNEDNATTRTDGRPNRRSTTISIGAGILLILALVGATVAIGRNGSTLQSPAAPVPMAIAGASASPATSPQSDLTTVQVVVQTANDEQQQAFAQNDPTLMQATATAAYYAQLVQVDAALRSAGVTAIQMLSTNFGPSTVQGSSAQVATTETWRATYADGTTADDTSVNDYTLVLVGLAWKISGDVQPSANIPPGATPGGPPTTVGTTSRNWSGYAARRGSFAAASAPGTAPAVSARGLGATA